MSEYVAPSCCCIACAYACCPMHAVHSGSMQAALHMQACTASAPEASRLRHLPDVKVATSAVCASTSMHGTAVGMVPYAALQCRPGSCMKQLLGPSVKFDLPPCRLRAVWEAGSSLSPASWHSKSDTASERGWHYSSSECGDPDDTCPPARPTQTRSQVQTLASNCSCMHCLRGSCRYSAQASASCCLGMTCAGLATSRHAAPRARSRHWCLLRTAGAPACGTSPLRPHE